MREPELPTLATRAAERAKKNAGDRRDPRARPTTLKFREVSDATLPLHSEPSRKPRKTHKSPDSSPPPPNTRHKKRPARGGAPGERDTARP